MRKFQKAALAGATAVAVAFGSTAVATAAEENTGSSNENQSSSSNSNDTDKSNGWKAPTKPTNGDKPATGSTKIGGTLGAHKDGKAIGTTHDAFFGGEGWTEQAPIYQLLFVGGIATFVSALVGLVFGPAYNFFVHGPSF